MAVPRIQTPEAEEPTLRARLERWSLPLALLVVAAAYLNALDAGFVWDDHALIEKQPVVQSLAPLGTYFRQMFWSDPLDAPRSFYRPLVTLSYALEFRLWNGSPFGFHLSNVLFHLVVVAVVFLLCRRSGASPTASALGAALFGTFPRLTESVTWISGRTDVLSSAFGLSALLAYGTTTDAGRQRWLSGVLLLGGLLCKEVAIVTVVAVALRETFEVLRNQRPLRTALRQMVPIASAVALYAVMRLSTRSGDLRVVTAVDPLPVRLQSALTALGHYARMVVLDPLRPQTQIGAIGEHPWPYLGLGLVTLVAGTVLFVMLWRRLPPMQIAAWGAAGAALAMVLHVVPLEIRVLAADRFLYVPIALGMVALALPLDRALRRAPGIVLGIGVLVVLAFSGAVALRNQDWKDDVTLFHQAAKAPGSEGSLPAMQLAGLLMDEGLYEAALPYIQRSISTEVGRASLSAYNNLGVCLSRLGRHPEAIELFQKIVVEKPAALRSRFNLALAYARTLRFDEAERELGILEQQLPSHAALPEYRALLARSRAALAGLPPASDNEPAEVTFKRALAYEDLTASREARAFWEKVVEAPDVTREQLLKATGTLVFNHELPAATNAVGRLSAAFPDAPELPGLREHLATKAQLQALNQG